jgi:hypothetical protein
VTSFLSYAGIDAEETSEILLAVQRLVLRGPYLSWLGLRFPLYSVAFHTRISGSGVQNSGNEGRCLEFCTGVPDYAF